MPMSERNRRYYAAKAQWQRDEKVWRTQERRRFIFKFWTRKKGGQ